MGKFFNKNKGDVGEKIAIDYFKNNGYRILHTNYTTNIGELDLVVTDELAVIFVEVKSRSNTDFGYPAEAVTYHKRTKINQVASQYIKKYRLMDVRIRFDIVEVYLNENRVNHIKNAFDSYLHY